MTDDLPGHVYGLLPFCSFIQTHLNSVYFYFLQNYQHTSEKKSISWLDNKQVSLVEVAIIVNLEEMANIISLARMLSYLAWKRWLI